VDGSRGRGGGGEAGDGVERGGWIRCAGEGSVGGRGGVGSFGLGVERVGGGRGEGGGGGE